MWEYHAKVIRVLDGDTIELEVDLGFSVKVDVLVRVRDLWCPEMREPGGPEAKTFVQKLFEDDPAVIIRTELTRSFIRYIATVMLHDGTSLADRVIAAGHGSATRPTPPGARASELRGDGHAVQA